MADKQSIRKFVEHWQRAEGNEEREARSFLIEFLQDVIGIQNPTRVLDFERRVKGRMIDAFYEDMGILIEAKSRKPGILDEARNNGKYGFETPYQQAKWYANELPLSIKPRWIIATDFDEFRIHDLNLENPESDYVTVKLDELESQHHLFNFFYDKSQSRLVKEKKLSIEAGEIVGRLYDAFYKEYKNIDGNDEQARREQRSLNILIVRLVFLLYAEDSGLLQEHQAFYEYMKKFDAQQSRQALIHLFEILDTPEEKRDPYIREDLLAFPWVNGELFKDEDIVVPQFTENLRVELLLNASVAFDWKDISPTIFGAVFESTLNPETRRAGGMHYTSIENIHKVIDPLFLDALKDELAEIEGIKVERTRIVRLKQFQDKLASINIFDPACGSGNFLTESYLQLRRLENRVIENLQNGQQSIGDLSNPVKVSITQFYGIEINDFAVSVARTALWIAESQMLAETQEIVYSTTLDFLPLTTNASIVEGNALRMDWNDVLPAERCTYICGNPPFIGHNVRSDEQKKDMAYVFGKTQTGKSDYVICWFYLAARYAESSNTRIALVATNSISQGESVGIIWKVVFDLGFHIDFAWTTFVWNSEAADKAHVHVVIVGFSKSESPKVIYDKNGNAHECKNINGYLIDAPNICVGRQNNPLSDVPKMRVGSLPRSSAFTVTAKEKPLFISHYPICEKWIRPYIGAEEFLNGRERYCLWLKDVDIEEINKCPMVRKRVDRVRRDRLNSPAIITRRAAATPTLFAVDAQPLSEYLIVPQVSSERRRYIPIGFMNPEVIASNLVFVVPDASLYMFGVLSSLFHNSWMRVVAGRLEMRYRYASDLVYNNFIWPNPTPDQRETIERAAQAVLDARNDHPDWTLAKLYDPNKMPADLLSAHKALDAAVEAAYGVDFQGDEEKIVAYLFKLYAETTNKEAGK